MKFQDKTINSLNDYISALSHHRDEIQKSNIWYRGHRSKEWELLPSIIRQYKEEAAQTGWYFFKRFIQESYPFIEKTPDTNWDWVFLMQHYGLPTNLLDWSESPLIALYFAVEEGEEDTDGLVWALDPERFNGSMNHNVEKNHALPMFNFDSTLTAYLPEQWESADDLLPIAAIPTKNSSRISAQHGVFTAHSLSSEIGIDKIKIKDTEDQEVEPDYIWRYIIKSHAKNEIRNQLRALKIDSFQIFPELSHLKDRIIKEAEQNG